VVSAVAGVLAGVVGDLDRPEPSTLHAADGPAVPAAGHDTSPDTASAAVTPPDVPSADPVLDRHDPAGAAGALTERRVALLTGAARLDGAALRELDLPGSPAHETDRSLLERLSARRVTLNGAQVAVHDVAALEATDERAEVTVEYEVSAHEQLAAGGAATAVPASGPRTSTLSLVWTDAGWRVTEVR
jgi:hypothetical protein